MSPSDLVQETLVKFQAGISRFSGDSEEQLVIWLKRILCNSIGNARRFHDSLCRQVSRESQVGLGEQTVCINDVTPSGQAMRREAFRAMEQALSKLTPIYRQVIELRHRERLSFHEISLRLDRSPDAARMLWCRAIERLKLTIEPSHAWPSSHG